VVEGRKKDVKEWTMRLAGKRDEGKNWKNMGSV
jgi:hypothetical protein